MRAVSANQILSGDNSVQLITYADRLGGDLCGLKALLDNELRGLFGGVHVLPFFYPIDGEDAGFDPIDHTSVDPKLGGWSDVRALASAYSVMADLIVNHVSAGSAQFRDVRQLGVASRYWDLFLRKADIFSGDRAAGVSAEEIERIYRPRPGSPFTRIELDDHSAYEFWTTFSANQLDINVETPSGERYLESILAKFSAASIAEIRLDAAGYAIKRRGTSCFMLPETFDFIASLSAQAEQFGMDTLVEIHSHYQTQIAIASQVSRVYDFALPPLVLHSLYTADAEPLKRWLEIAPRNCVTVLDTHDGIGILDVARQGDIEGLLTNEEIDALVESIHQKTKGESRRASGHAASNLDVYQVNSTYYSALGASDRDYLIARAIQFFAPGTPQVYYVGLLAGKNDMELVERTGTGRDINRHHYTASEIASAMHRPVVRHLMRLIRLRNDSPAFGGEFSIVGTAAHEIAMRWESADACAQLTVGLRERRAHIEMRGADGTLSYTIDDNLLSEMQAESCST